MAEIRFYNNAFAIKTEWIDKERVKSAPQRIWDKQKKVWILPPTRPNAMFIKREFDEDEITKSADIKIRSLTQQVVIEPFPKDTYQFPSEYPPMEHQAKGLDRAWGLKSFAFFFEMRLGKTYTALNLAMARYNEAQIDRLLIICPTPIKAVWAEEIEKFNVVDDHQVQVMEAGKKLMPWREGVMHTLIVGVEALSTGLKPVPKKQQRKVSILTRIKEGKPISAPYNALSFVIGHRSMCVVDESSRIKNWETARTEVSIALGGECEYRAILTGTPTTQGIHDLYAQFAFMDARIIGQKSYYTFRNRYMIMGGFEGKQIMGYRNSKELMDLIAPYSMVVKTKDVYDLKEVPPQIRMIQPTADQKKHFIELKNLMATSSEGETLEIKTVLERMTRFQQINGGNFPYPTGKDKKGKVIWGTRPLKFNPKLIELENMLDELGDQQVIIWARFVPEIEAIQQMLMEHGKQVVTFYGDTSDKMRDYAKRAFQSKEVQFFVGNQSVGGMGIKLSAADIMIYFSNTFSYEDKKQSLARSQEVGKTTPCLTIELVLNTLIDKSIMAAQDKKGGMAQFVDENIKKLTKELY